MPSFFDARQFKTLQVLSDTIIFPDEQSSGAIEARVSEFIDLLTSENQDYRIRLGGGLVWLDTFCKNRYEQAVRGLRTQ